MTIQKQNVSPRRALVLGGGGVTGIAWEIGVLTGLLEAGVALHEADTIIGTSAGSFVGVALASGYDMKKLFAAQSEPSNSEIPVAASEKITAAWYHAFESGGSDPQSVGAAFGAIAREYPEPVPVAQRRSVVEARLVTKDWPQTLQVTAIDADTGRLHVFTEHRALLLSTRCRRVEQFQVSGRLYTLTVEHGLMGAWCRRQMHAWPMATSAS